MDPRRREIFMGVPAVRGDKEMSYEVCANQLIIERLRLNLSNPSCRNNA